ncbi:MAG: hypothetical protein HOP29_17885 [Phycisphaerales bacterium]|nr:hypothetical protein [Phycisphaerales bacterium]
MNAILVLALGVGVGHTLLGPDHYVPFIALARAGRWTMRKAVTVASLCGVGHVLSSVIIGVAGTALLKNIESVTGIEAARGQVAAWLLCAFGMVYAVWGVRRGMRARTHGHPHVHADGTVHNHDHNHHGEHVHVHVPHAPLAEGRRGSITPWVLFTVFLFGPCEPLIPILMFPALRHGWWSMMVVAGVFLLATVATMVAVVVVGVHGLRAVPIDGNGRWAVAFGRYGHALAGIAIVGCGAAMLLGL